MDAFTPGWIKDPDPVDEELWDLDDDLGTAAFGGTLRSWSTRLIPHGPRGPHACAMVPAAAAALLEGTGAAARGVRYGALAAAEELRGDGDRVALAQGNLENAGGDREQELAARTALRHRLRMLAEHASWLAALAARVPDRIAESTGAFAPIATSGTTTRTR
ncbi:hypothetical protein ABIA38_003305 [Embleya sp. AB8]